MADIDQAFIDAYQDSHPVSIPFQTTRSRARASSETLIIEDNHDATLAVPATMRPAPATAGGQPLRVDVPTGEFDSGVPRFATRLGAKTITLGHASTQSGINEPTGASGEREVVLPPLGRERRPLSTFAAPAPPPVSEFRPAYEVDSFRWPQMSQDLATRACDLLAPLIDQILWTAQEGRSLMGIAGAASQLGTTTITLCLAKLLADSGKQVAIVDANFARGDLAAQLGLDFSLGWDRMLLGELPLPECAVKSLQDQVTLIPLEGKTAVDVPLVTGIHSAVMAGILRYHHDLVLFDLGSAEDPAQFALLDALRRHCRLDGTLVVASADAPQGSEIENLARLQHAFETTYLGVIGNRA